MTPPRRWTDDQLREAAATCPSLRKVYTRLGLRQTGGAHRDIRRAAKRLGITLPRGRSGANGSNRTWTDEDLRRAVVGATSLSQVRARLGLTSSGQTNQVIRRHAARLGLALPARRMPR